jgi:hypothetical protein
MEFNPKEPKVPIRTNCPGTGRRRDPAILITPRTLKHCPDDGRIPPRQNRARHSKADYDANTLGVSA